ncbi:DUF748 domain-containing protein [Rhabdobacter roseus]
MGIVVLLVIIRLILPYVVLRYVNKVLADMGEYTGHVEDIDLALYRGAYQIKEMNIRKVKGKIKEPFILIPRMDLSVQWKSLFKGKLVAEVEAYSPEINFAFSSDENASQTGADNDWTQVIKDLLPIQINRFAIYDGKIDLTSVVSQPKTDLSMTNFNLQIENIRNVEEEGKKLPSPVRARGTLPGYGGNLVFDADMMLLKQIPDFRYKMSLNDLQLVQLNDVARQYGNVDFEQGTLTLLSEMTLFDGKINGYLKPLTKDMKIFKWKEEDNRSVGKFFTELLAEAGNLLLQNHPKDQVATRIPLQGTIDNIETSFWPILINVLRNAYVEAFRVEFDNTTSIGNTIKAVREERKEKRQERREQRKEERQQKREERKKEKEKN